MSFQSIKVDKAKNRKKQYTTKQQFIYLIDIRPYWKPSTYSYTPEQTTKLFSEAELCRRTHLGVKEMNWNTHICEQLQARKVLNPSITFIILCFNLFELYSSSERFG